MSAESVGSASAEADAGHEGDALGVTGNPDDASGVADPRPMGRRSRFGPLVLVGLIVLVVDQLTKIWAVASLSDRNIDLFWTLRLNLIRNTGSAFGLGTQFGRWLALVITIVVAAMVVYARRIQDRRMLLLFGAIIGGAIGNLIDRALRADNGFMTGGVIDFVDFQWWPVFNVADMAVVLGALGLMAISLREPT